jgi:hypothetical protein
MLEIVSKRRFSTGESRLRRAAGILRYLTKLNKNSETGSKPMQPKVER